VRQGLPPGLARQYAEQAVDNAGQGQVVGTMGKVMGRMKSMFGKGTPDTPKSGGTSKPTR
jgi:hypothetical protein